MTENFAELVRQAFATDRRLDPPKYKVQSYVGLAHWSLQQDFAAEVSEIFGWSITALTIGRASSGQSDQFAFTGVGRTIDIELRSVFTSAGFDESFIFSGTVGRDGSMLDFGASTPIMVRATLPPSGNAPSYPELERGLAPFLTMAVLKATGLSAEN